MKRILVAGIGNIFLGDDAFGSEVARELMAIALPPEAHVVDFGIRGYDLAYALADGYDAVILVDATPRNEPPGTVCLIEPDLANLGSLESASVDAHDMVPLHVLQMAEALGGRPARLFLVGCEPDQLDSEDGQMGLSDAAQAAVPKAVEMVQSLIKELSQTERNKDTGAVPA
ncbi:MAG TPA: hydrogenase maturation protease [Candidatus Angelobacter sp.]|nr:hydrogenase maturation protease [Candidatus Angelobacter sp.]